MPRAARQTAAFDDHLEAPSRRWARRKLWWSISRAPATRVAWREIARQLGAEVEEIGSLDRRQGVVGYWRSAFEAGSGHAAAIRSPRKDPAELDLVVVATPIWVASAASPMRAYLATVAPALRSVAFVVTLGGSNEERALAELEEIAGIAPAACFVARQLALGEIATTATRFADQLRTRFEIALAPAAGGEAA